MLYIFVDSNQGALAVRCHSVTDKVALVLQVCVHKSGRSRISNTGVQILISTTLFGDAGKTNV